MKALIEIEITGDFTEDLSEKEIHELLTAVVCEGAASCALTGNYVIKEIIER
jgi:hypothetical protein